MKSLAIFALLPISAFAGTATLTWGAPSQNTDGSAITSPLTYKVYGGVQGTAKTVLATVSTLTYTHSAAPNGVTYCYQVSAVAGSQESSLSVEGCKAIPPLVPNPPTGLTVTVAVVAGINMAPVYKYTLANKRSADPAGYIPVGKECSGNVLFSYRGESFKKVAQSDVLFWATVASENVAAPCKKS